MDAKSSLNGVAFSDRQNHVVGALRAEIVSGVFKPGSRMPSHLQLVNRFGVSGVTVQHALNQLIRDGFLYSLPRKGTFVAPDPPHLTHYAVTFHAQPTEPAEWQQFWIALGHEGVALQQAGDRRLSLFYGIHGWRHGADYDRLVELVSRHMLAGIIFTSDPHHLMGTPLFTEPNIPRVAITPGTYPGVVSVELDSFTLWQRIGELLEAEGLRRLGLVTTPTYPNSQFCACMARRGIEVRPEWMQAVRVEDAEWAGNAARMMMQTARRRRPDVVFIADDNLVPHATAGIAASGTAVPDEVRVIAHANFPWPTSCSVPARRIGYDDRLILSTCVHTIDQMRAGQDVPPRIAIEAAWEDEVNGSSESKNRNSEFRAANAVV